MQRILMITESPNKLASDLKINDIYSLDKNPFCQFCGRLIFGSEELFIKYFNIKNIKWMHAKGSSCYDSINDDGKQAILKNINLNKFKLIITFGKPAAKILLPKLKKIGDIFISKVIYPLDNSDLIAYFDENEIIDNDCGYCFFPHPSGQAQSIWMEYSNFLSVNLDRTQKKVTELLQ